MQKSMKDTDVETFDDDTLDYVPRSKTPILIVILLALAAGGGYLVWSFMTAVEPLRVLVAIDFDGQWYEGSKPAAKLVDDVSGQLAALGFEPVEGGDPAVMEVLENATDLRSAAKSLKAAWVVGGRVKTDITEHPVDDGAPYLEVRGVTDIELFHVDDADDKIIRHQTQSWSGSKDKAKAFGILAGGVAAEKIGAKVVPSLVNHPRIATQLFGEGKDKKGMNAEIAGKLRKAEQYSASSFSQLKTARAASAAFKIRRLEAEKGPVKVTYHGNMVEDDGIIGAGPKGFLVKTEDEELFVDPDNNKLRRLDALESLAWKTPSATPDTAPTTTVLWSGYNIYSYPGVTQDGKIAALVEDLFGWAKTVTLILEDGTAKRLKIDGEKRFSSLKPSPTGKAVALYERSCRRCVDELVVLAADGTERFRTGNEGGTLHGFAWVSDDKLLIMHSPKKVALEGEEEAAAPNEARLFTAVDQTIWMLDLASAQPAVTAVHIVDMDVTLSWVRVSHDFKTAAFAARTKDGPAIAVLDIAGRALDFYPTPGEVSAPTFAPNGKWIAFNIWPQDQRGRDEEIGLMPAVGGTVQVLTDNRYRDRYPYFSHDSTQIYYESLDKDPNFNGRRSISVIASVSVPQ